MMHRSWVLAAIPAIALMAGCSSPIHIVSPTNQTTDPVTQVVASFNSTFVPTNAWSIDLEKGCAAAWCTGPKSLTLVTNLSAGFSPPPNASVTSTAALDVSGLTRQQTYTIQAAATCGFFCVYNPENVSFTPEALSYNSISFTSVVTNLSASATSPTSVYVGVQNYRSVPITVTIVETTEPHRVRLGVSPGNMQNPGIPVTVTIPANDTKAPFYIEGNVLGLYTLQFTAPGVITGNGGGTVNP
jgi:hypothetical protein